MQICIEEDNFASLYNTWVDSKNFVSPFASFSTVGRKVCGFITLLETIKNCVFRSFLRVPQEREREKGKEKERDRDGSIKGLKPFPPHGTAATSGHS